MQNKIGNHSVVGIKDFFQGAWRFVIVFVDPGYPGDQPRLTWLFEIDVESHHLSAQS